MPHRCFIGMGSNLADPARQIADAIERLGDLRVSELTKVSSIYRSRPMGPSDQPDFLNAVAQLWTCLEPIDLLRELQGIERAHGRRRARCPSPAGPAGESWRGQKWGPRTLDLDLLLYGDQIIDVPGLRVPHPGLHQRDFVLLPLLEIDRGLVIPGLGSVAELRRSCPSYRTVRYSQSPPPGCGVPADAGRESVANTELPAL